MYPHLFSKIAVGGKELKNRLTMAPLYLGYAGQGGRVSELILDHYRVMAKSGVAMVVVENATVDYPTGSGSNRTLRTDSGRKPCRAGSTGERHQRAGSSSLFATKSCRAVCGHR